MHQREKNLKNKINNLIQQVKHKNATQIHFNRFFFFFNFIPTVAAAACANQDFSRTHKNIRSENKTTSIR